MKSSAPKAIALAWASLIISTLPATIGAADSAPQPISSATTVLKALFSVYGTQATVVNDHLIRLEGPKRVFFGLVPNSNCKFVEMRPDDTFAGQIDFSHLTAEYETTQQCLGGSCGVVLTLMGNGPAVCWTTLARYPLAGTLDDFSKGKCASRVIFPRMDAEVARLVLRSVRDIQRSTCPPIEP